jgi:hypothetical protein
LTRQKTQFGIDTPGELSVVFNRVFLGVQEPSMLSAQDCAERLREQAYRTLLPQIRDLEEELKQFSNSFSAGIHQISRKLEALGHIELPAAEVVLSEILEEVIRNKDLETDALVAFAHGLRQKETQEEILGFLLDGVQRYFPRAALFSVRGEQLVGWSSRGYSEQSSKSISSCSFPRSENNDFEGALSNGSLKQFEDFPDSQGRLHFLHQDMPGPWNFIGLRALNRPVALVIAGGAGAVPRSAEALSLMMDFAALRVENIAYKILYELTVSRPEIAPKRVEPAALAAAALEMSPEARPTIAVPPRVEVAPASEPAPAAERAEETAGLEQLLAQAEPARIIPDAVETKPQPHEPQELAADEKLHSDAKRFARLLVSEIKLYNEHHVLEGRKNKDLYLRLKRDIDRSREMYEKRVAPAVSRRIDYFHDEIIRILGDSDLSTLGSDYPGPRVES